MRGLQGDEFRLLDLREGFFRTLQPQADGRLRNLAERAGIDLKADVYPYYSSDGSAYWQAGGQAEVALIGPGVDTSHGYERTHIDALLDTSQLLAEYLFEE